MKKYYLNTNEILMFFGISEKDLVDLIFKLESSIELNYLDILLMDKIRILNMLIDRRKNEKR